MQPRAAAPPRPASVRVSGRQRDEKKHQPRNSPCRNQKGASICSWCRNRNTFPASEQFRGIVGQDGLPGAEVVGDQVPLQESVIT